MHLRGRAAADRGVGPNNMKLSQAWAPRLTSQPETGMGYQVVTVSLKDGRAIKNVVIVEGVITKVPGHPSAPFVESDIKDIVVTHGN